MTQMPVLQGGSECNMWYSSHCSAHGKHTGRSVSARNQVTGFSGATLGATVIHPLFAVVCLFVGFCGCMVTLSHQEGRC